MHTSSRKKVLFTLISLLSIIGYGVFVFAAPPGVGGYNPGEILDPECAPNDPDCIVAVSGGSGWSLTGNTGTTAGTNFIGTTDAQNFVIKTNNKQIALFGQNGNVALGSENIGFGLIVPIASGVNSFATGLQTTASGVVSTVFGVFNTASGPVSTAFGDSNIVSGPTAASFGNNNIASGRLSFITGTGNTASGYGSIAIGRDLFSRNWYQFVIGEGNTDDLTDSQIFSIGNGSVSDRHNAYTQFYDGSFVYNDDNFQNDNPGTEQNMFYFNYGNHDGLGGSQTKRVIRIGSALSTEWNITDVNVGDGSVALGFAYGPAINGPIARGDHAFAVGPGVVASGGVSIAMGINSVASGTVAVAIGNSANASGDYSAAFGSSTVASGIISTAFGGATIASGGHSTAFGENTRARSFGEVSAGILNTDYTPASTSIINAADRVFTIGNGNSIPADPNERSDAFTILKNGKTGIGIDNFETTTSSALLQVGDSSWTGDMARFQNSAGTCIIVNPSGWTCSSDERLKQNITSLDSYGLDSVLALRPVTFDWKFGSNQSPTIGFIAQEVQQIIPSIVTTDSETGYLSLNTNQLTPVIIKAIQEMNLNITNLSDMTRSNTWRDSLIAWFGNVENGIGEIIAGTIRAKTQVCIDDVCVTKDQLQSILQNSVVVQTVTTSDPVMDTATTDNSTTSDVSLDPVSEDNSTNTDPVVLSEDDFSNETETEIAIPE